MSDDSDFEMEPPSLAPPKTRKRRKTQPSPPPKAQAPAPNLTADNTKGSGAASSSVVACYLCDGIIEDKSFSFRGRVFDRCCIAALRSYRRVVGKVSAQKLAEADDLMLYQKDIWKSRVFPLVRRTGEQRSASARAQLKQSIIESENYSDMQRVKKKLIVNKTRFKKYRDFWDGQRSSSASESFDERLEQQGGAHSLPGQPRVAMTDNEAEQLVDGEVSRMKDVKILGGVAESDGAAASKEGATGHDQPSRGRVRDRSRRRDRRRRDATGDTSADRVEISSRRRRRDAAATLDRGRERVGGGGAASRCFYRQRGGHGRLTRPEAPRAQ